MTAYFTLQWEDDHVVMLDQRLLPGEVRYIPIFSVEEMAEAIRNMTVRGAPAIGAAAAYGMALAALLPPGNTKRFMNRLLPPRRCFLLPGRRR